jgi:DNA gyrase/topoisomerase IV subunit A
MDTLPFLETAVERYGVYARHVLGFRHFGEGKDGAKPVQRRALWSMKRIGAVDMKHLTLAAEIMGFTTGNFHPHED